MALTTALGGLFGGLGATQAARTGTQSGTSSSTGSSTPQFNPLQTGMQGTISTALNKYLTSGPDTTPMMTAGTDAINKTYKGIGDRLQESLSARGFGNSGPSGTAALQTELGRAGDIGSLSSNLQSWAAQNQLQALGLGNQFAFAAPGYSTTSSGSSSGVYTLPGSAAASALGGALTAFNGANNMITPLALMGYFG